MLQKIFYSDIKIDLGNEKDTDVNANITVDKATHLSFVVDSDEYWPAKNGTGIIDFIDAQAVSGDAASRPDQWFYDSLAALYVFMCILT